MPWPRLNAGPVAPSAGCVETRVTRRTTRLSSRPLPRGAAGLAGHDVDGVDGLVRSSSHRGCAAYGVDHALLAMSVFFSCAHHPAQELRLEANAFGATSSADASAGVPDDAGLVVNADSSLGSPSYPRSERSGDAGARSEASDFRQSESPDASSSSGHAWSTDGASAASAADTDLFIWDLPSGTTIP